MSRKAAVSFALLAMATAPIHGTLIDSFTTNQATITHPPGGASSVATAGADIIGSRRDIRLLSTLLGAGPTSVGVSGGTLNFGVTDTTPDSRGEASIAWDGDTNPLALNPTGLAGVDLTVGGHTGFRIVVNAAGAGTELVMTVHTNANDRSRAALRLPAVAAATTFHLPFSAFRVIGGAGADFADVGAIELIVRGTETSATIDLIETAGASLAASKIDLTVGNMPIGSTPQTPGTTVRYRVTVTNTSGEAVNSAVTDTLDANVALVANTIDATPVAIGDQYGTPGNVGFSASVAQGLLANDADPDGGTITVTTVGAIPTALGGTATVADDGSFSYAPPVGAGPAVDTFNYSIVDGESNAANAVATITIGQRIWFVDDAHPGANLGTLSDPFVGITADNLAGVGGAGDQDGPGDILYFFEGTHPTGGLDLESGQQAIGAGVALVVDGATVLAAGTPPTLSNASGTVLVLASGNRVHGLNLGNAAAAGFRVLGNNFGALTMSDVAINGAGGALSLTNGTVAATISGITATNPAVRGILLDGVGGSLSVAGSTTVTASADDSLRIANAPASATYSFGTTSLSTNGAANGLELQASTGSVTTTFASLAITANNGTGLFASGGGTLNIGGTSNTAVATGGPAIDISSTSLGAGATFATVSSTNSATTGINLNTVTGSFTATGGSISGAAGVAFDLNAGAASVTYAGSITNTANRSIEITNRTGGTTTLSGNLNDTGTGVNIATNTGGTINLSGTTKTISTGANAAVTLATNTGATINFTGGGLDIDTTSGTGFSATGGAAAFTVQGSGNTITSTTGSGLNVNATTIGAAGLTFQSISSNGGSNAGISLVSTGSTGSLTVTGTGAAGSGGTIANKGGANLPGDLSTSQGVGIFLNNTTAPSFASMQLNDFSNFAIRGNNVVGFTLTSSVINGINGDDAGADEGSLRFDQLTGSASIANSSIAGTVEDQVRIINSTGTLNRITVDTVTFGNMNDGPTGTGANALMIESTGTAVVNATIQNSIFTAARATHINRVLNGTGLSDTVITGNTISNTGVTAVSGGGAAIRIFGGNNSGINANATFNVSGNTMRDSRGTALAVNKLGGSGTFSGTISNNTIGVVAVANSGSSEGSGIFILNDGSGPYTASVTGNTVRQYGNFGIFMQTGGSGVAGSGTMTATVTGNTVSNPGTLIFAKNGFQLNGGVTAGDTYQICLTLGGAGALRNTLVGTGTDGGTDFRLRQRQSTTVRLPGYAGANNDDAAVVTFAQGNNNLGGTPTGSATNTVPTGGGWIGGAACP